MTFKVRAIASSDTELLSTDHHLYAKQNADTLQFAMLEMGSNEAFDNLTESLTTLDEHRLKLGLPPMPAETRFGFQCNPDEN